MSYNDFRRDLHPPVRDNRLIGRIQELELFVKFVGPKLSALGTSVSQLIIIRPPSHTQPPQQPPRTAAATQLYKQQQVAVKRMFAKYPTDCYPPLPLLVLRLRAAVSADEEEAAADAGFKQWSPTEGQLPP